MSIWDGGMFKIARSCWKLSGSRSRAAASVKLYVLYTCRWQHWLTKYWAGFRYMHEMDVTGIEDLDSQGSFAQIQSILASTILTRFPCLLRLRALI